MIKKATFSLEHYSFDEVYLNLKNVKEANLALEFAPKGKFLKKKKEFQLDFVFNANLKNKKVIMVSCNALFRFTDISSFEEIPSYFFPNSIAIIFPYVRAMVSTLTLQANVKPVVLPTMNLSSLQEQLKNNTQIID